MKEMMTLRLRLESDYLTTVRLATGGICSLAGLNLDDSEDCKVCVTESLLVLMHAGYRAATLRFCDEEGVAVRICGEELTGAGEISPEDEISFALLGALVPDLHVEKEGDTVSGISFRFGR